MALSYAVVLSHYKNVKAVVYCLDNLVLTLKVFQKQDIQFTEDCKSFIFKPLLFTFIITIIKTENYLWKLIARTRLTLSSENIGRHVILTCKLNLFIRGLFTGNCNSSYWTNTFLTNYTFHVLSTGQNLCRFLSLRMKMVLGGLWTLHTLSVFPTAVPSFLFLSCIFCDFTFCFLIFLCTVLSKLNVMGVLLSKRCLTKRWKCSRCGLGFLKWKQGLRVPNWWSCLEPLDLQKGEGEDLQNCKEKN